MSKNYNLSHARNFSRDAHELAMQASRGSFIGPTKIAELVKKYNAIVVTIDGKKVLHFSDKSSAIATEDGFMIKDTCDAIAFLFRIHKLKSITKESMQTLCDEFQPKIDRTTEAVKFNFNDNSQAVLATERKTWSFVC